MRDPLPPDPASEVNPEVASLVIIDDDAVVRELLRRLVESLPCVRAAAFEDPQTALVWCRTHAPDLILTDHRMPGFTGTSVIELLRREGHLAEVPIMIVTGHEDRQLGVAALECGATDVLTKPIEAAEVRARVKSMLTIRKAQRLLAQRSTWLEGGVSQATAALAAREREIILRLSRAAEYRDWETGAHIIRVSMYARVIAHGLGLTPAEQDTVFQATPMHDVGKVGVPDSILLKPGSLDEAEHAVMQRHTVIGHEILKGSGAELLEAAAEIALTHHERYDGSGYPEGRRGEAIPLRGRMVAVADSFDALTSNRPYKEAWPKAIAWAHIEQNAGTRFDPGCVAAFAAARLEVEEIRAAMRGE